MATIKDVAKLAGVSISSVSNYLNNRPGLSDETANRIARVIDELHYVVRNAARDLRGSKNGEIAIVFPGLTEPYLEKLMSSIKGYLTHSNHSFYLELTDAEPELETKAILDALGKKVAGLILYTCQQDHAALFRQLECSKVPYVLIDRKPDHLDCNLVLSDDEALMAELVCAAAARGIHRLALVLGPDDYDENRRAVAGAQRSARQTGISLQILHTVAIRECGFKAGVQLLVGDNPPPQLILTNSFLMAEGIRYAMETYHISPRDQVQIVCTGDCIHDVFYSDDTIAKTSRPTFEMGERIARLLLENMKSPVVFETEKIRLPGSFQPGLLRAPVTPDAAVPKAKTPCETITVLLIDEESSVNSLSRLLGNFYAAEGIDVRIKKVRPQDQFSYIEQYIRSGSDEIDVFLFDIPWLSYFASKGYLLCLEDLIRAHKMSFDHFIPGILPAFGCYEGKQYALPYLACVQLLFYRRDLFRSETLRREFERQNMLPLKPPKNWLQFNAIAKFFTRSVQPDSPVRYGHSMTVSYPENLLCDLMPRIWSYDGSLFDRNQRVRVDTPCFPKAVRSMAESALYSAPGLFSNSPIDTVDDFSRGDCAMFYTYNYFAIGVADKVKSQVYRDYAVVPIPGRPVLSGWSLGIAPNSRHVDAAFRFLRWASGEEMAIPQTILGGQSPNLSVYRNYDMATLYPWLPLALGEFGNSRTRLTPLNAAGQVANEKAMENIIYQHLDGLLRDTVQRGGLQEPLLAQTLQQLQTELDDCL